MQRSYFSTLCLLVLHQIDAAYWREWEMFHLPGGIQGYLAFNLLAIPILLLGYTQVVLGGDKAILFARLCAALGALTFLIHAGFALAGFSQFHLPLSMALIVLCLTSALWQLFEIRRFALQPQLA
ncbi:MAG TPA: DUF6713 family protein [Pseudomonas sp.]|nr:DUF6713 family protein [Pseudomonas sp.]